MNLTARLKARLARTHNAIMGGIESVLGMGTRKESLERLEEALITADVGVKTSSEIVGALKEGFKWDKEGLSERLRASISGLLKEVESPLVIPPGVVPFVIMVLGVNGVGKTTTIGKLASRFSSMGKSVILGAGDTFRAAAIEQLEIWGERAGCPVIKHSHGGDPGAVAFDAVKSAVAKKTDVVILDTAGRLHTKVNLMEELKKIKKVVNREIPSAPHENLLVVDASTGQNALNQAKLFNEYVGVTGIVITKLDGTAKGGIIVPIARELKIPIRFIGVGEGVDDLKEFNAGEFADALI
ncbi:MAG: signal recognition particle-docking protein FtsY [Deltaproteobacteria bacterium]|nr:signal recognition particle-docking protein FtsY [Deltaproteobacteria bacterium]